MKKIGFVVLLPGLILALAGSQTASAQSFSIRRDSLRLTPLPAVSLRNRLLFQFYDEKAREGRKDWKGPAISLPARDSVRIMSPDNMACLVPDRTKLEKMPVMKLRNRRPVDPMPNAIPRQRTLPFTP